MEYVQMNLDDWMQMKQRLQQELVNMKQSFVRTGYFLRKIEDGKGYEIDGYKSLAEFAKAEYGLSPSSVSRFKALNRAYSIDGYSEMIDPKYMDFRKSMLEEMLNLSEEDRKLIGPESPREVIRDLKRHNEEAAALIEAEAGGQTAGDATAVDPECAENAMAAEEPDLKPVKENKPKKVQSIRELVEEFYRANPDVVIEIFTSEAYTAGEVKKLAEIVNPSGNRTYKNGLWFMAMYENGIKIKQFAKPTEELGWGDFFVLTQDIFAETASGADTYRNHFGELPEPAHTESAQQSTPKREKLAEKAPKSTKTPEKKNTIVEKVSAPEVEIVDAEGQETVSPKPEESVEKSVDNLPGDEVAPAQKSLERLDAEVILESSEIDESAQWKTAAQTALDEIRAKIDTQAWAEAVASTRRLLHYLEVITEGGQE